MLVCKNTICSSDDLFDTLLHGRTSPSHGDGTNALTFSPTTLALLEDIPSHVTPSFTDEDQNFDNILHLSELPLFQTSSYQNQVPSYPGLYFSPDSTETVVVAPDDGSSHFTRITPFASGVSTTPSEHTKAEYDNNDLVDQRAMTDLKIPCRLCTETLLVLGRPLYEHYVKRHIGKFAQGFLPWLKQHYPQDHLLQTAFSSIKTIPPTSYVAALYTKKKHSRYICTLCNKEYRYSAIFIAHYNTQHRTLEESVDAYQQLTMTESARSHSKSARKKAKRLQKVTMAPSQFLFLPISSQTTEPQPVTAPAVPAGLITVVEYQQQHAALTTHTNHTHNLKLYL